MSKKINVYQVEDSVPVPVRITEPKLNLVGLEIGQSIAFPRARRNNVQSYASALKRRKAMEFTISIIDEQNCRIWRVK